MSIFVVKEADDCEGRSFSVRGYIKADSEKEARKIASQNSDTLGVKIDNTGFYRVEKLGKKEGKAIVKSMRNDLMMAEIEYEALELMLENLEPETKKEKMTNKMMSSSFKVYELLQKQFKLVQ